MGIVEETAALSASESEGTDLDSEILDADSGEDTEFDENDAFGDGFGDDEDEDPDWGSDEDVEETDDAGSEDVDQPELHTIKVGGEEISLSYEELLAAAQQGQDYTRKTQQLAEDRKQLAAWQQVAEAFDEDPEAVIRGLAAQFGVTLAGAATDAEDDIELELMDPLEREVHEMRQEIQRLRSERESESVSRQEAEALAAVHAELDSVASKFGVELDDTARDELIQFALDHRIGDLEAAYEVKQAREARRAPAERPQTKTKRSAPPVEGGRGRSTRLAKPGGTARFESVEDAFEAAFQAARG